jgi:hypothetical protein
MVHERGSGVIGWSGDPTQANGELEWGTPASLELQILRSAQDDIFSFETLKWHRAGDTFGTCCNRKIWRALEWHFPYSDILLRRAFDH